MLRKISLFIHQPAAGILAALLLLLPSCAEEIDLTQESRARDLIVEGRIAFGEPADILLQTGAGLAAPDQFHPITSARVRLSDNEGESEILAHEGAGRYRSSSIIGKLGRQYTLEIEQERNNVTGIATMPRQVIGIDSVVHRYFRDESNFLRSALDVYLSAPSGQAFFGWIRLTINGTARMERYFLQRSGAGGPPLKQEMSIFPFLVRDSKVVAEFTQVDEAVFHLFRNLSTRSSRAFDLDGFSVAPGILSANLSSNTPGYFGAFTVDSDSLIVR